ncbi:ABC transporter ATP-binding protein [Rubrivivax sp. JA1026]|uniref:ABC transporter ATP-binding protein n=1 Tax=Rubrivivax sp. JA1026 TaxID=2710888 RepID=UPI0013E95ACC|nr:ABC transporter ATP-binding protein [Rubrivivax sp. JA1026]
MNPAISIRGLRYRWPRAAAPTLAIEAWDVEAGEAVFLHGPSGGGKSTLLGLLAGVLLPGDGRVEVLGQDWAALAAGRRDAFRADHVGYVFQQFNLLPYLSVLDNVRLPCRFSVRRRARTAAGDAEALLERVGLPHEAWARPAAELSVGQQQRVAAARALIGRPELVICDEPTSALDTPLRDAFLDLLLAAVHEAGATLVFVSHDERLAGRFDRRVALAELNGAAR